MRRRVDGRTDEDEEWRVDYRDHRDNTSQLCNWDDNHTPNSGKDADHHGERSQMTDERKGEGEHNK